MIVSNQGKGKVFLIGAGPGDPKLITVKGLDCIRQADAVVYDRLASIQLLREARSDAELIYVGKSPQRHTLKQHEINKLLVDLAAAGKVVARLKGGDPFVFGRGGEEAEALVDAGFPFEVVPGITSAIAVPAYAGIPVTHRGFTSSFGVITGNEDPDKEDSSIAWDKIATGLGTLVFLMGMANLPIIAKRLVENGRAPATPVALIRWGTRTEQQTLVGTLTDIAAKAEAAGFANPAIILVGEVVQLRQRLQWFEHGPLFGKRVIVTRSRPQASSLSAAIEALGGEPWEFPTIAIKEPQELAPLDQAIHQVDQYQWVVFTSVNGVEHFFQRLRQLRVDIRRLAGVRLAAIGPQTAASLESYGLTVDYVPQEYRAEAVAEGLTGYGMVGQRVLLARADIARPALALILQQAGAAVDDICTYRTVQGDGNHELLLELLAERRAHVVTFTSSSTVRNFVAMLPAQQLPELLQGVTIASIGPITSATARELGLQVDVEAQQYTIDGLVNELVNYLQTQ